jgi:hypothetical protein
MMDGTTERVIEYYRNKMAAGDDEPYFKALEPPER